MLEKIEVKNNPIHDVSWSSCHKQRLLPRMSPVNLSILFTLVQFPVFYPYMLWISFKGGAGFGLHALI